MADAEALVHEVSTTGPGTHALVIGVGRYQHLLGGEQPAAFTDGMKQLSSPPLSARKFAEWLITDYHFPGKPLASLSLLRSESDPKPFVHPVTGESCGTGNASIDSILAAISSWKARGHSGPDNRLIFYFCGHGIGKAEDTALLCADFNGDDDNPLNQALDLRQLILGLNKCQASEQIFFIDACRASSDTLLPESGPCGRVPLLPGRRPADWPRLFSIQYFATLAGEKSHAIPDRVSLFTDALLRGLGGVASDNPEEVWRVDTSGLQAAIHHFMTQPTFAGKLVGVQVPTVKEVLSFDLHVLQSPPVVPVYVGCADSYHNHSAYFRCEVQGALWAERPPIAADPDNPSAEWVIDLEFGRYDFSASIAEATWRKEIDVRPQYRRVKLEPSQ
jgi:hypothetical protein